MRETTPPTTVEPDATYHIAPASPIIFLSPSSASITNKNHVRPRTHFTLDVASPRPLEARVDLGSGNESSAHQDHVGRRRRIVRSACRLVIVQQIIGDNVNEAEDWPRNSLPFQPSSALTLPRETVLDLASNLDQAA